MANSLFVSFEALMTTIIYGTKSKCAELYMKLAHSEWACEAPKQDKTPFQEPWAKTAIDETYGQG